MGSPYIGAVGIAVSDLDKSVDFYSRAFGLVQLMKFSLPDMNEVILGFEGSRSAALVLMHYTDGIERNVTNLPIKVVFYVLDPVAVADAIRAEGLEIVREPTPVKEMGDAVVGFAKDPDGYTLELLQK
jgi:lactoylglutathione lyase